MLDVESLRRLKYAEPFKSFEIEFNDGSRALIDDPSQVGWSERARIVMFPAGWDAVDSTDFSQVVALHPAPGKRWRPPRGKRKAS